ncbi:hypothetical protein JOB18_000165 [Solea senegalensis]|uniref:Uncharacterized protein n=1 Tax=Solea senegalensis TaxID=28829 RepID=A0AAV6RVR6_SOLSE|nr:hypothetical protein JOB18_000165 [Solea senegalensis]
MELMELSVNTIHPHIQSCVKNLTDDQWSRVASGSPDTSTTQRLAHMLLKMLSDLSGVWSKPDVILEQAHDSLKGSVTQSFGEVLRVESVHSSCTDQLAKMIAKEVEDSVKTPRTQTRITPSHRLKAMIHSACKILRVCARTNKNCYTETPSVSERGQTASQKSVQSVENIIIEKVNQIVEPILDDISHKEYNLLQEVSSLETQCAADDIAQSFTEAMNLQETKVPGPKSYHQTCLLLDRVTKKICEFFVKRLIKALTCQIISQVKAKFTSEAINTDNESLRSLLDHVESVLLTSAEIQTRGNELCAFYKPEKISPADVDTFTWEISTLLYKHITGQIIPQTREAAAVMVPRQHTNMYLDIRNRVIYFLSLISWWLSDQALHCSDGVLSALIDHEKGAALQNPHVKTYDELVQATADAGVYSKFCLGCVITEVFMNTVAEVKDSWIFVSDLESKLLHLVDETWAELDGFNNVDITPKDSDNLYKAILKDLRKCCSPLAMLIYMSSGDSSALRKVIVMSCKTYLKKQNCIMSRVGSTVRKGFSSIFS